MGATTVLYDVFQVLFLLKKRLLRKKLAMPCCLNYEKLQLLTQETSLTMSPKWAIVSTILKEVLVLAFMPNHI